MSRVDPAELVKLPTDALQVRATELAQLVLQAGLHGVELTPEVLAERQALAEELRRREQ